jgi:hypothetical protein
MEGSAGVKNQEMVDDDDDGVDEDNLEEVYK